MSGTAFLEQNWCVSCAGVTYNLTRYMHVLSIREA